jgi:hypothetical protein
MMGVRYIQCSDVGVGSLKNPAKFERNPMKKWGGIVINKVIM